jgi:hypothetical protein
MTFPKLVKFCENNGYVVVKRYRWYGETPKGVARYQWCKKDNVNCVWSNTIVEAFEEILEDIEARNNICHAN